MEFLLSIAAKQIQWQQITEAFEETIEGNNDRVDTKKNLLLKKSKTLVAFSATFSVEIDLSHIDATYVIRASNFIDQGSILVNL